ncbi:MAG TPA: hypothetical protein EYQ63_29525 [Fuerstia sp.]|nr:hypothetical protein [Fuerstiella sp.]
MPRKAKLRRRSQGYTASHRLQLRIRWDYFNNAFGNGPDSIAAMKAAWKVLRSSVMEEHIHERPGTRPWAWWQFDAPEKRNDNETETEFLRRLSLLTAAELTAL